MLTERNTDGWIFVEKIPDKTNFRVLLLPGLHGSDLVFKKLLESSVFQNQNVKLIAGNPPGFKGLPVPENFDFSIESFASLYEQIAEKEKIDLIVGHSFSANVLIELAAKGKYKGKLMLISPSLYREAETKELLTLDSMSRKPIINGIIWWITYQMMSSIFKPYFTDKGELASAVDAGKKIPREIGRKTLLGYFNHIDQHKNLSAILLKTKVPVYYVRGSKDDIKFTDIDKSELLKSPLIKFSEIDSARHFAMIDKPDELAKLIIESLS
jgi:pimeloyl-ACP methyl ester carboxylesterase